MVATIILLVLMRLDDGVMYKPRSGEESKE